MDTDGGGGWGLGLPWNLQQTASGQSTINMVKYFFVFSIKGG